MDNGVKNRKMSRALDHSVPYNAAELIDYSSGSVVSRTIEKGKTGTITLFSFDAGQELSEHSTPYNAYAHIIDGQALLVIGGKDVKASTGVLVLMPADVQHAVYAEKRFKMILTMIKNK